MTKINFRKESAIVLDQQKLALEASIITDLNRIFTNIANDASNIYRLTGTINSRELAENYRPELLSQIRDAFRKSIKKFGFTLRKTVEKKYNLIFNAENKIELLDVVLKLENISNNIKIKQLIEVEDENLDEKIQQINNQFFLESTFFVANESETQNNFVTDTNTTMIQNSIIAGLFAFSQEQTRRQEEVGVLQSRLFTADPKEGVRIARMIDTVNRQINTANDNRRGIVADNIKTNLLDKKQGRSGIIASQNVGLAEAWARQTEAELIDGANLLTVDGEGLVSIKTWQSILDTKTRTGRFNHVRPDGQVRAVDDSFDVSNERLISPRDRTASIGNTAGCRCIAVYVIVTRAQAIAMGLI